VLFGRRTGCQLTKEARATRMRISDRKDFPAPPWREVRRGGVEADANEILVAPRGQRVHHRAQFGRPVFLGGQNDRARAADRPCAVALPGLRSSLASGLARPAMPDHIKMEPRGNPIFASKVSVSCCCRQRLSAHCTGRARGNRRIVRWASSNQREERFSVAFSRELLACQLRSTTRPLPRQASCTHRSTGPRAAGCSG
jgi:hypothetical protein